MAADLNQVSLLGRLGADPEVRSFQDGTKVANLRVATGEQWKDKQTGEKKERTDWHQVVIIGPLADVAEQHLKKGARVMVQGALKTRKWQDKDGQDRYSTEVVLQGFKSHLQILDWAGDGNGRAEGQRDAYNQGQTNRDNGSYDQSGYGAGGSANSGGRDLDDEIPFGPEVRI